MDFKKNTIVMWCAIISTVLLALIFLNVAGIYGRMPCEDLEKECRGMHFTDIKTQIK